MTPRDVITAVFITFCWGMGFIAIKTCVDGIPSLVLCATRSIVLCAALIFIRPPKVSVKYILAIGFCLGILHSLFAYLPVEMGLPASTTCLVLQTQVFFTVLLAAWFYAEPLKIKNIFAMTLSFTGIAILTGWSAGAMNYKLALFVAILSALTMGLTNMILKKVPKSEVIPTMAWSHLTVPIPLLLLYMSSNEALPIATIMQLYTWKSGVGILYLAFVGLFTYGAWGKLLQKYPTYYVAPFSLLTPIFGISASVLFLGENFTNKMLWASCFVFLGLVINQLNLTRSPKKTTF